MRALALVATLLTVSACGGTNDILGGGTFSCDLTKDGHSCLDYSWGGGAFSSAAVSAACTSQGGTAGSGCSHTGAVGGCKLTTDSGGVTVNTTSWFYAGTAADLMTSCTAQKGTWVAP